MPGKRKRKNNGIPVNLAATSFDFGNDKDSTAPNIEYTKYGPKMTAGYVSYEKLQMENAPILVRYPLLGLVFLDFRSNLTRRMVEMVPYSELIAFIKYKIDIQPPDDQRILYKFLANEKDLKEAVNQYGDLATYEIGEELYIKRMSIPHLPPQ